MLNRILSVSFLFVFSITFIVTDQAVADTPKAASYEGAGLGTSGSPYQISNLAQLRRLSETPADWVVEKYFVLTADIDATDTNTWNVGDHDGNAGTVDEARGIYPIGTSVDQFLGSFDGQGHVIRQVYINIPNNGNLSFFGYAGTGSTISNLGLEEVDISGNNFTGGLVGYSNSTISSCYATVWSRVQIMSGGLSATVAVAQSLRVIPRLKSRGMIMSEASPEIVVITQSPRVMRRGRLMAI